MSSLAGEGRSNAGATEAVRPDVEADVGGGRVLRQLKAFAVKRVDGEDVAVCAVARRRAGAAVVVVAVVVACMARAGGQVGGGVFVQAAQVGGQVDDVPVPEAGAGWRVRVVAGKRETFGANRRVFPVQCGRVVLSACVAVHLGKRQGVVVAEIGGGEGEGCHGVLQIYR